MAAPATYMRTIHSSLTSASAHHSHHTPSAWASASAASVTAQYHLNHGHHHLHTLTASNTSSPISNAPIVSGGHPVPYHHQPRHASNQVSYGAQGLMHTPSISTHNAHMYTHHLRDLTHPSPPPSSVSHHRASGAQGPTMVMNHQGPYIPGSGDGDAAQVSHPQHAPLVAPRRNPPSPPPHSRRRSASIRMPPSYRFDPFGDVDESLGASGVTGFSSSGGGGMSLSAAATEVAPSEPEAMTEQEDDIGSFSSTSNQPYMIHIPPAAPTEIQQYTPQPQLPRTPSPAARSLPTLSPRAASFASSSSAVAVPKLSSSASALGLTYAPTTPATSHSFPAPNLSKIVAGMMLNRVHAPKPMRRRVVGGTSANGRQYVKSCLSSVVSVEV